MEVKMEKISQVSVKWTTAVPVVGGEHPSSWAVREGGIQRGAGSSPQDREACQLQGMG